MPTSDAPPRRVASPSSGTGRRPGTGRTLWEQGRLPGRGVVLVSVAAIVLAALAHLALGARLGIWFDLLFVPLCVWAALAVRPPDFFAVGVLPPLALAGTLAMLALVRRASIADAGDGLVQAVVSGLAHHAAALAAAYALTLGVLALRQLAARNHGRIRPAPHRARPNA